MMRMHENSILDGEIKLIKTSISIFFGVKIKGGTPGAPPLFSQAHVFFFLKFAIGQKFFSKKRMSF